MLPLLQHERAEFVKIIKRVLQKRESRNPRTLHRYKTDSILAFNTFTSVLSDLYDSGSNEFRVVINENFQYARDKIEEVLKKLKLKAEIPQQLGSVIYISSVAEDSVNALANIDEVNEISDAESDELFAMAMTKPDFLKLCASTINRNYKGDPLALEAFSNAVALLKELATNDELKTLLKAFVKAKLEGRALEALPAETPDVDAIIAALKAKIVPDNSKIIEGKMAALKTSRKSLQEFATEAEELAEALRRALIVEGISQQKADDMTIERTVEMCRASARSDIVKSILASTKFDTPKEAVAKFIVETGTAAKEHQVFSFRTSKQSNGNNNGNQNSSRKNKPNNGSNQFQNRNGNQNGNFNGNRNRNNNSNNPQRGFRQNNSHGAPRQNNSQGGYRQNNSQGGYRQNNFPGQPNNGFQSRNVHVMQNLGEPSGNLQGPHTYRMGDQFQ